MENSSNSLEMQIDSFLEQFKRSASKAMDGDWTTTTSSSSTSAGTTTAATTTTLVRSKSRTSYLDGATEMLGKNQ